MVSEQKIKLVNELKDLISSHTIIGIVNLENLPTQQLQVMRATLGKKGVRIIMARKNLLKRALEEVSGKDNLSQLIEKLKGMPAILFSNDNPYSLYSTLQKSKSEAPAKAGQTAPKEIVVRAGATNFAPGPIISELASAGIKTKVENGKLTIIGDVTVAKEGDEISAKLAETLKRLDIKPMEIGLDLVCAWENGFIFNAKDLRIDEAEYTNNFTQAHQWAFNLAIDRGYLCAETVEPLIQKSFREAKALAIEGGILSPDTVDEVLAKAESQATSLKSEAKL
ncbi:MAG: 50S ribosomal protein L10 [archaeon]|nr:50S ribosomal protein L10 [Nanoarchaeota archaeon]